MTKNVSSCFAALSTIEKTRNMAHKAARKQLVEALVFWKLDLNDVVLYPLSQFCLFNYCSPVWDSCGVGSKAYLDKLNRRAACIIEGRGIGAEELKSTLGWSNLKARRNYLKCVLVHKCLHGIASSYLLSEFRHVLLFRAYNTRSCDLLRPPFAKTTRYQGSFRINGAWTYNSLPKTNR